MVNMNIEDNFIHVPQNYKKIFAMKRMNYIFMESDNISDAEFETK